MASTIITKYGSGAPTASDLVQGELAVDLTNKRLYTEDSGGNVIEVGINPSSLTIGGTALTATAAELNTLDGITATTAELNTLDGITATVTELNYTDGVTSNIQTQLNTKAPIASPTFTGTVTAPAVNVNGTVTADNANIDIGSTYTASTQTVAEFRGGDNGNSTYGSIEIGHSASNRGLKITGGRGAAIGEGYISVIDNAGTSVDAIRIKEGGDIIFYEDTGTTAKFFWDASAESLGIGTTSPDTNLQVKSGTGGNAYISVKRDNATSTDLRIGAENGNTVITSAGAVPMAFYTNGSERMRIDSSGNLGIGLTTPSTKVHVYDSVAGGNVGLTVQNVSTIANSTATAHLQTANGTWDLQANRSGYFEIITPTNDSALRINSSTGYVSINGTGASQALDVSGSILTTGGIYLGGTGAANLLDDYEEGTFTPAVSGGTTAGTGTYTSQVGMYTKVGNVVHVDLLLAWTAHTGSGVFVITGLPFTTVNVVGYRAAPSVFHSDIALTAGNTAQGLIINNSNQVLMRQVPVGGGTEGSVPLDTSGLVAISLTYKTAA